MRVCITLHGKIKAMKNRDPFDTQKNALAREDLDYRREQIIRRIKDLLEKTMRSEEGRELIFNLLEMGQVNASSFNTNALAMAYQEGRRSFGLSLQALVQNDHYLKMLEEANERGKQSKRS